MRGRSRVAVEPGLCSCVFQDHQASVQPSNTTRLPETEDCTAVEPGLSALTRRDPQGGEAGSLALFKPAPRSTRMCVTPPRLKGGPALCSGSSIQGMCATPPRLQGGPALCSGHVRDSASPSGGTGPLLRALYSGHVRDSASPSGGTGPRSTGPAGSPGTGQGETLRPVWRPRKGKTRKTSSAQKGKDSEDKRGPERERPGRHARIHRGLT